MNLSRAESINKKNTESPRHKNLKSIKNMFAKYNFLPHASLIFLARSLTQEVFINITCFIFPLKRKFNYKIKAVDKIKSTGYNRKWNCAVPSGLKFSLENSAGSACTVIGR